MHSEVNLPGTKGTVIKKAVPSGGDRALHFVRLKLVISPNVGDSGAQFLVGGDCVRASPKQTKTDETFSKRNATLIRTHITTHHFKLNLSHVHNMHLTRSFNPLMAQYPIRGKTLLFAALRCVNARAVGVNRSGLRFFTTENEEVRKARRAAASVIDSNGDRPTTTIFGLILSGEIPAKIIHEDEKVSLTYGTITFATITVCVDCSALHFTM